MRDSTEPTTPTLRQVVLDCENARALAEFYRQLLGFHYRPGDEPPADGTAQADAAPAGMPGATYQWNRTTPASPALGLIIATSRRGALTSLDTPA